MLIYSTRWLQVLFITTFHRPRFIKNFQYWWISCCKLQFTPYYTNAGIGNKLQITCLVSVSHFGYFTACLAMPLKLPKAVDNANPLLEKNTSDNYYHNLPKTVIRVFLKSNYKVIICMHVYSILVINWYFKHYYVLYSSLQTMVSTVLFFFFHVTTNGCYLNKFRSFYM